MTIKKAHHLQPMTTQNLGDLVLHYFSILDLQTWFKSIMGIYKHELVTKEKPYLEIPIRRMVESVLLLHLRQPYPTHVRPLF